MNTTGSDIQRTSLSYVDKQMAMITIQKKDKLVPNRQINDLWVKMTSPDTEIGQRQNFNEYELVQNDNMENLRTNENRQQTCRQERLGNDDYGQLNQLYRDTKTE